MEVIISFNGSGVFVRLMNWTTDAANGILIRSDRMDTDSNDFVSGLTNCLTKDGQSTTLAAITFAVGVRVNDGLAGSPPVAFTSETSTGLYRPGTGQLGVTVTGTQVATFTSTGLDATVIGGTTPAAGSFTTLKGTALTGTSSITLGTNGGTIGSVVLEGSTSGATTVQPNVAASGVLTLPAATDTLIGKATTDTLTNKTFDTAGTGNVLKINGTALTVFPLITTHTQHFSSGATYTPSTGMLYCIVEMVGAGGGGGGISSGGNYGSPGGSGGYLRALLTATQVSTSQTITIGASGTAGSTSGTGGGTGGTTSVGSLLSCTGGAGGTGNGGSSSAAAGGAGGAPTLTTGTLMFQQTGQAGSYAANNGATYCTCGAGGSNPLGAGAPAISIVNTSTTIAGLAPTGFGAGGGGAVAISGSSATGFAGGGGYVLITEFCSQ